jgi:hypothetical protein
LQAGISLVREADDVEITMTAIARAVSHAFRSAANDGETLTKIALLCAAGLFISLLMLVFGVDLSPAVF